MTPALLRSHLAALGMSQRGLADAMQRDDRLVRRWLAGDAAVPADAAAWIERAARELPPLQAAVVKAQVTVDVWFEDNPPPGRQTKGPNDA